MKPWPTDAVIIVAARAGEEERPPSAAFLVTQCRDCGAALIAAPHVLRAARNHPGRQGRPVQYLCWTCADQYDPAETEIHDKRPQA